MWSGKRIGKVPLTKETMDGLKTAVVDIVKGRHAPPILKEERLRICDTCPHSGKQCKMCGCHLKTKVSLLNSECPLNKW